MLTTEERADQRLMEALSVDDEALMPPRRVVEDLLGLLADHGVDATAGWRALEQLVNPRLHAEVIQAHPALVDGIVVPDQAALEKAQAVLADAHVLPPAAVFVTTAESLEGQPEIPGAGFVVEPTPALHDPMAAAGLREQAAARIAGRVDLLSELSKRRERTLQLGNRLDNWLREHPRGDTEQLRSAAEAASAAAADAKSELDAAREAHTQAVHAVDAQTTVVAEAEETAADAVRIAESFGRLAEEVTRADIDRVEVGKLEEEAEAHRAAVQELRTDSERLRNQATEHAVQAESLRRDAASYADRLKKVVVGNQPPATDTGESDLAALEIAYQEAADAFRAVQVGEDLRQRVNEAQKDASDLRAQLLSEPANIVARAEVLAASPEAGSSESLEATKRRLGRAVQTLSTEHGTLTERVGRLHAEASAASQRSGAPWTSLDADWTPSNPADGSTLTERAATMLREAETRLKTASEGERIAKHRLRNAEAAAREMQVVHRSLIPATRKLELPTGSAPFTGTADEAQRAAEKATEAYGKAFDRLHDANQAVDDAVSNFRETANQNRFGKLKAPIYKQLTEIDKASLIERADQWAVQLQGRAASLTTDLENSERHRKLLIDQLKHYTGESLALLEKAERLSRLPEGAGIWAGRRILKIGFARPESQTLAVRIAETLDENARTHSTLPGRDLVLRCVGAAVPRDFKVEILKPDSAGRAEYASISEMGKVFSGGQELTGAIMLYCTLAALRSSTRTGARSSVRLGGMLILDNPIGKASADYLLTLQMNMAAALGVQLIYTTGNMEDRVLATFPLCIRLRNDADQRTGIRHLHVTDRVVGDAASDEDRVTGQVSAARLLVRPREPEVVEGLRAEVQQESHAEMTDDW